MIKFLVAIIVIVAVLAAVWILVLRAASREMQYPGIDDVNIFDDEEVK